MAQLHQNLITLLLSQVPCSIPAMSLPPAETTSSLPTLDTLSVGTAAQESAFGRRQRGQRPCSLKTVRENRVLSDLLYPLLTAMLLGSGRDLLLKNNYYLSVIFTGVSKSKNTEKGRNPPNIPVNSFLEV